MLRYTLETRLKDPEHGCEYSYMTTIDGDADTVERELTSQGISEMSYKLVKVVSVEPVTDELIQ